MRRTLLLLAALAVFVPRLPAQLVHSVTLRWTDLQVDVTWTVYRFDGGCTGSPVFSVKQEGLTEKTYIDFAVTEGAAYCYVVTAVRGEDESVYSNAAGGTIPSTLVPLETSIAGSQSFTGMVFILR